MAGLLIFVLYFWVIQFSHNFCYGNLVINTWGFSNAAETAWNTLSTTNDPIEALEAGCSYCEDNQCDFTVGFGGSPDENGETTLDALIFDGNTMDVGAVGALRRVKSAVSVAKHVLQHTQHTLLVGDQATQFASDMGFKVESLSTNESIGIWKKWKNTNCQPNYWKNVEPDPKSSCGPYQPISQNSVYFNIYGNSIDIDVNVHHDTIGMIVLNNDGHIVAGTSTNGLRHKIPGRVGDSPIPGSGAYADSDVGAACATGDGDTMMRFLPSFLAVEVMRNGGSPSDAAKVAVDRMASKYPTFSGGVIAVNKNGEYGAACNGISQFPFSVRNDNSDKVEVLTVNCTNIP